MIQALGPADEVGDRTPTVVRAEDLLPGGFHDLLPGGFHDVLPGGFHDVAGDRPPADPDEPHRHRHPVQAGPGRAR